jgi:hemin uptake protein HemP
MRLDFFMHAAPLPQSDTDRAHQRELDSEQLFAGATEVVITHHGTQYRLRITRQDKLILTK